VKELKYLGITLTDQNSVQEEIKSRLKTECLLSFGAESFSLLSKNLKIEIYRTINLPVLLNRCETWALTLRNERRLRAFDNRVLRIFGPKRDEVTRKWRKSHNEELNYLNSSLNFVQVIKSRRMRWAGHLAHMGERKGVYRVLVGNLRVGEHLGDLGVDGRIILRWI
jgi:hypothetical protein